MQVTCVGGPFHGLVVELPKDQDVYRPRSGLSCRYIKLLQATVPNCSNPQDAQDPQGVQIQAYFAHGDLSEFEATDLVMELLRRTREDKFLPAVA